MTPSALQPKAPRAMIVFSFGIQDRQLDDLTVRALHQDAIAALKFVLKLAERGLLPGGIEDQIPASGLRRHHASAAAARLYPFGISIAAIMWSPTIDGASGSTTPRSVSTIISAA